MILRIIVGFIGLIQIVAPHAVTRFWLGRCCQNPEDIQVKPMTIAAVRVQGLVLVGWVLWQSREEIAGRTGYGGDLEPEFGEEWLDEPEEHVPSVIDTESDDEEEEGDEDEQAEQHRPTLTPGTRRFELASVLYHADGPLTVADIVELSEGTDWELGRSPASTTLYRMYNDDAVEREQGDAGSYQYWLTEAGQRVLEESDEEIAPKPS